MTKQEMASYLSSLISIMDSFDDAGGRLRPTWLAEEYHRVWDQWKELVQKEKDDETR